MSDRQLDPSPRDSGVVTFDTEMRAIDRGIIIGILLAVLLALVFCGTLWLFSAGVHS